MMGNVPKFTNVSALSDYVLELKNNAESQKIELRVCAGPGCSALGSLQIYDELLVSIDKNKKELTQKG